MRYPIWAVTDLAEPSPPGAPHEPSFVGMTLDSLEDPNCIELDECVSETGNSIYAISWGEKPPRLWIKHPKYDWMEADGIERQKEVITAVARALRWGPLWEGWTDADEQRQRWVRVAHHLFGPDRVFGGWVGPDADERRADAPDVDVGDRRPGNPDQPDAE